MEKETIQTLAKYIREDVAIGRELVLGEPSPTDAMVGLAREGYRGALVALVKAYPAMEGWIWECMERARKDD